MVSDDDEAKQKKADWGAAKCKTPGKKISLCGISVKLIFHLRENMQTCTQSRAEPQTLTLWSESANRSMTHQQTHHEDMLLLGF